MGRLKNKVLRAFWPCLAALAIGVMTGVLADQASAQVTSAQQSAIKASCRSDFMAKCSSVTPGGKDALACLQQNVASLSSACKTAVSATLPPPAPAPKAAAPAAAAVAPAPADTAEAPAANKPIATETADAPAETPAPPPAVAAPPPKAVVAKPAKTVAVVAAPAGPTAAQQSAMKQACRSDFMSRCSGVAPGGKDALVCLQRNVAALSPACKQVVSATMGGAPAPAAAAAPATVVVATPTAAPTPQQLSAVKFTCRGDFSRHCRGIQPGGPEALACLQSNAARLTPDCKTSLAALGDAVPASAAATTTTTVVAEPERRRLPPGITPVGRIIRRVMERNQ
jgi:hypothetical protein